MAVQQSGLARRVGVSVVGIAAAATLFAGCSSSGGGKPASNNNTSSNGGASSTSSNGGGSGASSSSSGGGGGSVVGNAFCTGFNVSELQKLGDQSSAGDVVKAWDQFAKDAPSEIKTQVQDIDKYLHDVVDKNYTDLQAAAQKIGQDGAAIGAYYAAHCHA